MGAFFIERNSLEGKPTLSPDRGTVQGNFQPRWVKRTCQIRTEPVDDTWCVGMHPTDFEDPPPPMNLHEFTQVVYPRSLYTSFENVHAQEISVPWHLGQRMSTVKAARPKNTYYRGFMEASDVQGGGLPLRPQISVISTVRLYFGLLGKICGRMHVQHASGEYRCLFSGPVFQGESLKVAAE